ncbi:hypothetical protein [Streptomyces sp. NPDC048644]|uniref:hypothetical protein n=1 Tax=Streptomyces sp. NPDC048644 TaxID=3365582 RepID=UPI00371F9B17
MRTYCCPCPRTGGGPVVSAPGGGRVPSVTSVPQARPGSAPPPAGRRTAWADGVDELRAAARTEPGRLRAIGAVLALLVLLFGAVTAWQVSDRAGAARDVAERSQPLSADAADLYRSLADADTTAASGFLAGGDEPRETRARYAADLATASDLLVKAAGSTQLTDAAGRHVTTLNRLLPRYTGLIETARADNRQGLPLGGAYLRYANERMRGELLPAARAWYDSETGRLAADHAAATAWPWASLAAGAAALGALGWAQRRSYLRTNRVFNRGLVTATTACVVLLVWLVGGHTMARTGLGEAFGNSARSLRVLNEARIDTLRARGDENLTLVARGARLTGDQQDFYEAGFRSGMKDLAGGATQGPAASGSALGTALALADDEAGRQPVRRAVAQLREWQRRHAQARAADDKGDYDQALRRVIGTDRPTRESFDRVDAALRDAVAHEQDRFRQAAGAGRGAFGGLAAGACALAVVGAAGAVLGIGRRLSEYR